MEDKGFRLMSGRSRVQVNEWKIKGSGMSRRSRVQVNELKIKGSG